jgi:DNA polymerase III epsilon subunit-like protein
MKHLNGAILGVIDVETTGFKPGFNDLIEVCVLLLDKELKPTSKVLPFHMDLKPQRPRNIDFEAIRIQQRENPMISISSKGKIVEAATIGCDPFRAADLFVEWFENLKLAPNKRIMPIAHNWVFDRAFMIDWLGEKTFDMCFDPRYRDTMSMSLYDNDVADYHSNRFPFPKNNLQYLCSQLNIERTRAHTALDDCVATAEVYKRMIQRSIG